MQQGIWMEAVRLLEGERGLMMDWREAVVRVVRRAVVVRRVGVRSFIFFGGGVVWCLRRRGVLVARFDRVEGFGWAK